MTTQKIEHSHAGQRHEEHIVLGVVYMILAAICFSSMSLLGKIIGDRASTDTILFSRFIISFILVLPWVFKDPKAVIRVHSKGKVILRSFFGLLAFGSFFYALRYISLADALLLNNTCPLFVPVVVWMISRAKTPRKVWAGIILGFIGVGLVLNIDSKFFDPMSLVALLSGVFAAIAIVIIRTLTRSITILQILFYNFFISSIISGILLPFSWKSLNTETLYLLLGVGLLGAAYQYLSTLSYTKAPVRITSPLMFLCIIFGAVADILIWDNIPSKFTVLGMALVILGGAITIYYGQKTLSSKSK